MTNYLCSIKIAENSRIITTRYEHQSNHITIGKYYLSSNDWKMNDLLLAITILLNMDVGRLTTTPTSFGETLYDTCVLHSISFIFVSLERLSSRGRSQAKVSRCCSLDSDFRQYFVSCWKKVKPHYRWSVLCFNILLFFQTIPKRKCVRENMYNTARCLEITAGVCRGIFKNWQFKCFIFLKYLIGYFFYFSVFLLSPFF